jgi:hypothetical protein
MGHPVSDTRGSEMAAMVAATPEEFDRLARESLPDLLERATSHTRRFLRETGQWADDISHEKLALRWGYEFLERFLTSGRAEAPCRPFLLLDSLIAKYFSQCEPLCYHQGILSPPGKFLDGLTSRAVVSRDALMALFYHLYGFGQGQVVRVLGLGPAESQRVYKNFERWRRNGWQRAMAEIGITDAEVEQVEELKARDPNKLKHEATQLLKSVQNHYRKSEPQHFPCLSREQWADLFEQGYGYDYRAWHLALCRECLVEVCRLRPAGAEGMAGAEVDLHVRPLLKGKLVSFVIPQRKEGRGEGNGSASATHRVSAASH